MKKKAPDWFVPTTITLAISVATLSLFLPREIKATIKTNKLHVGDTFHVESYQKDPFKQANVFGGTIINKKGPFIQYIDDDGDTCSTNIRDAYLFPKTFKVTVTNCHGMNQ